MRDLLKTGAEKMGLHMDEHQLALSAHFSTILREKNEVMNLTAITDDFGMATLHFLDSLSLQNCTDFSEKNVLDIGSGAGFPGMPLAIANPTTHFTLLDALAKRTSFLQEAAQQLGLENVTAIHGRAEELGQQPTYREQFDIVTSRAVADLTMLCELALPFVRIGGIFLAMKSVDSQPEIDAASSAITVLGGKLVPHVDYRIEGTEITHRIVGVKKVCPTPTKYPRRFSKIQKQPLSSIAK